MRGFRKIVGGVLLLGLLAGCELPAGAGPADKDGVTLTAAFTQSGANGAALEAELVAAIEAAKTSIDVAMYELDLPSVTEALVQAHKRGVQVRLVTEGTYRNERGPVALQQAGAPVVIERRDPFMHDKFIVIDGRTVWTGSWNFTYSETYRNDNNVVILTSAAVAEDYTTEFEEMFTEQLFGPDSPANTPHPQLPLSDGVLEIYFAPEDKPQPQIVAALEAAQSSIRFMAFTLTDNDIAGVLSRKQQAGLLVEGVVEEEQITATGADYEALRQAGVDVRLDGNPYTMHHKVIIVDEAVVITGSYNFTRSAAESNDENVLIIHSPELAARYLEEFSRVYQQAQE